MQGCSKASIEHSMLKKGKLISTTKHCLRRPKNIFIFGIFEIDGVCIVIFLQYRFRNIPAFLVKSKKKTTIYWGVTIVENIVNIFYCYTLQLYVVSKLPSKKKGLKMPVLRQI